jgi:serine/threonine protein kinase
VSEWLGDATVAHLRDVGDWPDLGDRYEVRGRLGHGGMSVVYEARDRVLDRSVAVKVVDGEFDATAAERLLTEARILGRLEHPAIVPVHDAGVLPDGRAYYAMKKVQGNASTGPQAGSRYRSGSMCFCAFVTRCRSHTSRASCIWT